jgi:hypothetical protein
MIFFCEDCGGKNELGQADLKSGRANFRCCSCDYHNSYPVSKELNPLDIFKKKIQGYPEIIGAFLYHGKNRTITNYMPPILTPKNLELLGDYLTKTFLSGLSQYSDIQQLMITISDKHITIRKVEQDLFIFLIATTLHLPGEIRALLISTGKREDSNGFS